MTQYPDHGEIRRPYELDYSAGRGVVIARFMNSVYAWMCVGLAMTALVAWYVASQPQLVHAIFGSGLFFLLIIAQLALVWTISAAVNRISAPVATALFILYAALNGATLSLIFFRYSLPNVGGAFLVTAGTFGVTSAFGFLTRRDLSSLGGLALMGLIGVILASVVNIFWANSTLYWIVTYAGVFIFIGLTAYDTQRLKEMAIQLEGQEALAARLSISGALALYLDFINLFLFILRIMGGNRRN